MESTKANQIQLYDSAIVNLRYLPNRKLYDSASKDIHENIHSSAIHYNLQLATTQMSINDRMDKLWHAYSHNETHTAMVVNTIKLCTITVTDLGAHH